MFITVRLKWVIVSFLFIVFGLMLLSANLGGGAVDVDTDISHKTILIDAGHGLPDAGASANGVSEESLNLKVALKLRDYLEQNGIKVVMTREDENGIHDENASNKKRSDLNKRVHMMDDYKADMLVSIHMNKFPESKYKGAQVFYSKNNKESKTLGKTVQKELIDVVDKTNNREAKEGYDSIFLLKHAKIPAILVECGFLSNPEEAKLLQQDDYQNILATAIGSAIIKYYENAGQSPAPPMNQTANPSGT